MEDLTVWVDPLDGTAEYTQVKVGRKQIDRQDENMFVDGQKRKQVERQIKRYER